MFRTIQLQDKEWMDRCRSHASNDMTVLSFPAVYTWQSSFGLTVDGEDDFYIIKSKADNGFYYPVGDPASFREYVLSLLRGPEPVKFLYVPESELEWLGEYGCTIACESNTSEYVYSSRSFALLDNGAGTNFRVKVRHFSRDNDWSAKSFDFPSDTPLLEKMVSDWIRLTKDHPVDDHLAVLACAEDPEKIGLSGLHLETSTGEWAFLLGYPSTPQIYDMTILKYSDRISRNVVATCICEMAKLLCDTYPYINLEDDLGEPGLRKMKQLYRPLFLLNSYTAYSPRG